MSHIKKIAGNCSSLKFHEILFNNYQADGRTDGHTDAQNCWNLKLLVGGVAKNSLGESKDVQSVQMYNTCGENVDIPGLVATLKVEGS